ncbi:hypothetical protein V8E36_008091 [Tilletia maclaganii]
MQSDIRTIRSRDTLAVVNTNHDCKGQGCAPSLDGVCHRGGIDVRVINECAFRSAVLSAEVSWLQHVLLDDTEMGRRLSHATGATGIAPA